MNSLTSLVEAKAVCIYIHDGLDPIVDARRRQWYVWKISAIEIDMTMLFATVCLFPSLFCSEKGTTA